VVEDGLVGDETIAVAGVAISGFGKMFFPGMKVMPVPSSMETLHMPQNPPAEAGGGNHGPTGDANAPAPATNGNGAAQNQERKP
jgi:hypothetical protein